MLQGWDEVRGVTSVVPSGGLGRRVWRPRGSGTVLPTRERCLRPTDLGAVEIVLCDYLVVEELEVFRWTRFGGRRTGFEDRVRTGDREGSQTRVVSSVLGRRQVQ